MVVINVFPFILSIIKRKITSFNTLLITDLQGTSPRPNDHETIRIIQF